MLKMTIPATSVDFPAEAIGQPARRKQADDNSQCAGAADQPHVARRQLPFVFQNEQDRGDDADVESFQYPDDAEEADEEQDFAIDRHPIEPRQQILLRQ